jgi:integrase/recombinase XerD
MNELLTQIAEDARDLALIGLLYGAGLRVSEAVTLAIESVALDEGFVRVFGKGNKERVVPLGEPVLALVRAYLETGRRPKPLPQNPHLFPGRGGRGHLTRQAAFYRVRHWGRAIGLPEDVTPHTLTGEHTAAT